MQHLRSPYFGIQISAPYEDTQYFSVTDITHIGYKFLWLLCTHTDSLALFSYPMRCRTE